VSPYPDLRREAVGGVRLCRRQASALRSSGKEQRRGASHATPAVRRGCGEGNFGSRRTEGSADASGLPVNLDSQKSHALAGTPVTRFQINRDRDSL